MSAQVLRFTAADRALIVRHAIGKPTGIVVEIGGMQIDLVPLTTEQADEVFAVIDVLSDLFSQQNAQGEVTVNQADGIKLAVAQVRRLRKLVRDVLHESALASDQIDDESVFDEWFNHLSITKDNLEPLVLSIIQASGLKGLMGNLLTRPSGTTTPPGTESASI